LVATEGHTLLPHYTFEPTTAVWHHRLIRPEAPLSLHDVSYDSGRFAYPRRHSTVPETALAGYLDDARRILDKVAAEPPCAPPQRGTDDFEHLRWFPLPGEPVAT